MNGKWHTIMIALVIVATLTGGPIFNRWLVATPALAHQNSAGQQWEYCTLTKASYVASNRGGVYWISYFRDSGVQVIEVEDPALEKNGPAKAIAKLGVEGWEMVGQGPLEISKGTLNALYFKRPKQ